MSNGFMGRNSKYTRSKRSIFSSWLQGAKTIIGRFLGTFLDVDPQERLKVILLALAFCCIIGGYTVAKELKDSLFVTIVGREYIPWAKIISMLILIPFIVLYSRLVDLLRKHQLLYTYTLFYGLVGLIVAYFIGHPTIGLANTATGSHRLFGWFIYFFVEGYSPFVVSLFYAFINSVTSPEAAKKNYPLIIAGSRVGGIIMALFALMLLRRPLLGDVIQHDVFNHQVLFAVASLLILFVPITIYLLMTRVSGKALHGYEATYIADKQQQQLMEQESWWSSMKSSITVLVRYPYAMGIFALILFWEVVNVVFAYERLGVGQTVTTTLTEYTRFLFEGIFYMNLVGLALVMFGTRFVLLLFGERLSLILVPVITGSLLVYYLTTRSATAVIIVFVLIRAVNYVFSQPLRESLFIPTSKTMRFKTKSWIDAFGAKTSKAMGSYYNIFLQTLAPASVVLANGLFFTVLITAWIIVSHRMGRRFEKAVRNNEVIGLEEL